MPHPKWDQHSILAELRRRGMTLTRLAEIHELNPGNFRRVWSATNRKAEAAIADFLGIPVAELFPDRYPIRTSRVLSSKYAPGSASAEAIKRGKAA
jgi:Ner family transcriptional regulator